MDASISDPHWIPRLFLLALLAYFTARHFASAEYAGIYAGANLVVHEAGHALFSWFGSRALEVAGGSLLEIVLPVLVAVLFIRQRDPFAVTVCVFWLATTLLDVSVYVGDARAGRLPLVTVGGGAPIHDWGYLLGRFGLLESDWLLSDLLRDAGLALMVASLTAGGWVVSRVRVKRSEPA